MDVLPTKKEKNTTLGMALGGRPARRRSIHQSKKAPDGAPTSRVQPNGSYKKKEGNGRKQLRQGGLLFHFGEGWFVSPQKSAAHGKKTTEMALAGGSFRRQLHGWLVG